MVRLSHSLCAVLLTSGAQGFTSLSRSTSTHIQKNASISIKKQYILTHNVQPLHTSRGGVKLGAWPLARDPKGMSPDYPLAAARIGITIASTYFTWYAQGQYSNVMASSAFTLICSMMFDKRLGQAAFCGTFAGMCSTKIIPTYELALTLGAVTSLLFEVLIHYRNDLLGIGGRLGATAFLATSIVAAATGVTTGFKVSSIALSSLKKSTILPMALWHAAGSVATIILREVSDDSAAADPVRASAVVGLAGALLLKDKTAALALYGGSFVGMSLPSRLMQGIMPEKGVPKPFTVLSILTAFAAAGALGGIAHGATINWKMWPGGWGGKAGTCAFVGCVIFRMFSEILSSIRSAIKK